MADAESHTSVFVGDSEMAARMRSHDWTSTPLGIPTDWPDSLKLSLRILLTSRFEMWLGWGPDIHVFYNDAYRPTLGIKHPKALGTPMQQLWPEIWDDVAPLVEAVYARGEATWSRDLLLLLERSGYPEETYHTFSYSPVLGDDGSVQGLFCAVTEETTRVIGERRIGSLRELAERLAAADSRETVMRAVETAIAANPHDLPFTLTYLYGDTAAELCASTGIPATHASAAGRIDHDEAGPWPIWPISEEERVFSIADMTDMPMGAWTVPPVEAALIPLMGQGGKAPIGTMVIGLNPYRQFDQDYLGFLKLLAGQIASGLASADAFEAERRRAAELAEAARMREEAADALRIANRSLVSEVEQRTAERDRMQGLFQNAPGFMCVLRGREHVIEFMNEAYLQLVGHRDILELTIREALPEIDGQGFYELLDNVFETGTPFMGRAMPVNLQRTPGAPLEKRFINLVYQPIVEPSGRIYGIFAEGHDITDQLESEAALRDLNATLEQRIATALQEREDIESALRQAQKMEAVGQLTGGIAHDFNNLLTGIIGSLDLMQRKVASGRTGDLDRHIMAAATSANRAAALTHRLLAFSRRQPLDPRPVDANRLVLSMEDLVRRSIGESLSLEIVTAGGLWQTLCDPHQLESALLNLAINARDAMPDGGKLTIETCNAHLDNAYAARQRDVTPGQYVCIGVSDTGSGMSPDIIAKAFDPFFTTKPIGQGTGLGLSMVYGFARQSDGYARIYSDPGHGTTVKLYLPRHYGDGAVPEEPAAIAAETGGDGEIVLVVEDETAVRDLVVEVLGELGYRILQAEDGPAGLAILQSAQHIDLLVTDVGLPGLNGRQLADAARENRPDLKILFMTGYAENAAINGGFLEPGMAMITKPFPIETFSRRIGEILGG